MNETIETGAGPSLAAHSKDASVPGETKASSETGNEGRHTLAESGGVLESASKLPGSPDGAADAAASASEAVGSGGQGLRSGQGDRAADQLAEFVREKPILAFAVAGTVCFVLGILLGRR